MIPSSIASLTFLFFRSIHCCLFLSKAVSRPCGLCLLNRWRENPPILAHGQGWLLSRLGLNIASTLIAERTDAFRSGPDRALISICCCLRWSICPESAVLSESNEETATTCAACTGPPAHLKPPYAYPYPLCGLLLRSRPHSYADSMDYDCGPYDYNSSA